MQHSKWWLDLLILVAMAASALLLWFLNKSKSFRLWPSLATYAGVTLVTQPALYFLRPHYRQYFYAYLLASALCYCLRFWILADISRATVLLSAMPSTLRIFILGTAAVIAVAGASAAYHTRSSIDHRLHAGVLLFDRTANIALTIMVAAALCCVVAMGFAFYRGTKIVVFSLTLRMTCAYVATILLGYHTSNVRWAGNALDSLAECTCILLWAIAVRYPLSLPAVATQQNVALSGFVDRMKIN